MDRDHVIEALKRYQRAHRLCDVHLVSIDRYGFAVAHTDAERERQVDVPLSECPLDRALSELDEAPAADGVYVMERREHDPVSESFRSLELGWTFANVTAAFDVAEGGEARTPVPS